MDRTLQELIWQVALFRTAIEYKVDFFELARCNTVEEYNRECPIAQISQFLFGALKKTMGGQKICQGFQ